MFRALFLTFSVIALVGCNEKPTQHYSSSKTAKPTLALDPPLPHSKRVALVIGNANYQFSPLKNPKHDAIAMAATLRKLDFKVILLKNASHEDMEEGLTQFETQLGKGVVGLFYFSGHGVQIKNQNYLLPTSLKKVSIRTLKHHSMTASEILSAMQEADNSMNIMILDACRDNPFKSLSKSVKRGLATIKTDSKGTLIAYATSSGDVAADGEGRNSPYTTALLKYIVQPNITIESMFKKVRNDVSEQTDNNQTPWESSSLKGQDFYFARKQQQQTVAATTKPIVSVETPKEKRLREQIARNKLATQTINTNIETTTAQNIRIVELEKQAAKTQKKLKEAKRREKCTLAKKGTICRDRLKDGSLGPEMVWIPKGSFRMGDIQGNGQKDEQPVHRVSVERFAMGKYEVTVREFGKFVTATGYKTNAEKDGGCYTYKDKSWKKVKGAYWAKPGYSQNKHHPVVCVSQKDSIAYANWLSKQTGHTYRLPTEAQWEYAARAGTSTSRYWGNNPDEACDYANVHDETSKRENGFSWTHHQCTDGYAKTAPVGSFKPNKFGLYDMIGNVWEWNCSEYSSTYSGLEKHCKNRASLFVLRGASWNDGPRLARSANRLRYDAGTEDTGLRLARIP